MKMLQDGQGNTSSMRIMGLICTITACVISVLALLLNRDLSGAGILVGAILAPALVSKSIQTFGEKHE